MTTTLDYALFALNAYFREDVNQGPFPPGWRITDTFRPEESRTGFAELSARMAVSVEVMTGQRRVLEFVLSPVMQHVQESGRER